MSKEIKIFNKNGDLVRTYGEKQSDENMTYQEKAKIFAEKNGFSMNEPVIEEAAQSEPEVEPTTEELAAVGVKVEKPKKANKKK